MFGKVVDVNGIVYNDRVCCDIVNEISGLVDVIIGYNCCLML